MILQCKTKNTGTSMSWIYQGTAIKKISDLPKEEQEAFGFIYCIVLNHGGKAYEYYGRKNFFSVRTKRASKKQIAEKGKLYVEKWSENTITGRLEGDILNAEFNLQKSHNDLWQLKLTPIN